MPESRGNSELRWEREPRGNSEERQLGVQLGVKLQVSRVEARVAPAITLRDGRDTVDFYVLQVTWNQQYFGPQVRARAGLLAYAQAYFLHHAARIVA